MDGSVTPVPAVYNDENEAMTVTVAFFGTEDGWFGPQTLARLGGMCPYVTMAFS